MKHVVISATAAVALIAAVPALAQQEKGGGAQSGPSMQSQSSPKGEAKGQSEMKAEPKGEAKGMEKKAETPPKGEAKGFDKKSAETPKGEGKAKGGEKRSAESPKGEGVEHKGTKGAEKGEVEKQPKAQAQEKSTTGKKSRKEAAEERKGKSKEQAAEPSGKQPSTATETSKGKAGTGSAEGTGGKAGPAGTAGTGAAGKADQGRMATEGRGGQHVQVSEQQRTRIHDVIFRHNPNRVSRVNFDVRVGTHVPRGFHLAVLPADVVAIVPEYRDYRYFVVEDRICIVDPRTDVIVEVIDRGPSSASGGRHGGKTAGLHLTTEQRRFVYDHVDWRAAQADVRIRLALGAEVPRQVELVDFPREVVADIPELRDYRYLCVDRDLVIVDPDNREVALVINNG
jgi:hypothetical protein